MLAVAKADLEAVFARGAGRTRTRRGASSWPTACTRSAIPPLGVAAHRTGSAGCWFPGSSSARRSPRCSPRPDSADSDRG